MRLVRKICFILIILILFINTVHGEIITDEEIIIPEKNIAGYKLTILSDDTYISIIIKIVSGSNISLYLMDENNYEVWQLNERPNVLINEQNISGGSFSEALSIGNYFVILDNSKSLDEVTVNITINKSSSDTDSFTGTIALAFVLIVTATIVIIMKKGNKNKSKINKQQIYPHQNIYQPVYLPPNTCRNCQNEYNPSSNFCIVCGNRVS